MIKGITRIGKTSKKFKVEFCPLNCTVYSKQPFTLKLFFSRGKGKDDQTKPEQVSRSLRFNDDKVVQFPEQTFSREGTFFIHDNGEIEKKEAVIKLYSSSPGVDDKLLTELKINLSDFVGQEFDYVEEKIELDKKSQVTIVKKVAFKARLLLIKNKDAEIYGRCVYAKNRKKAEIVEEQKHKEREE